MDTNYKSIILAIGLFLALTASISAAPGDLDLTFGSGGKVITPGIEEIFDLAIQPDGKIVAVSSFGIFRYNANGSLDSSFGTGSYSSVAIQADGKIIAAGTYISEGYRIQVARHHPNGTFDTTFNGTGIIITPPFGSNGSFAGGIAIQTDGKIVVAGSGYNGSSFNSTVFRYHSNGTPDTSFNGTGSITTAFSLASSLAIQPDGRIIVVGNVNSQFTIFRYNANGSPDISFGGTGVVTTTFEGYSGGGAHDLAIQSDGKIVAKGVIGNEDENVALIVRYNLNGSPDTTFGNNGVVLESYDVSNVFGGGVAAQPDGKIVTVGRIYNNGGNDFGVARYNSNGSPDTTFGEDGIVTTDFGVYEIPYAVAIQADGKIVAAGVSSLGLDFNGALARYQGGSRTRFDFDGDGRADVSVFRPLDRVWYLNQSTNEFSATQFGLSTDKLTPADYDGDGKTDIAVYRDGTWYWLNSSDNSFNARQFGIASDIPVPANYYTGGNGGSELAVYRNGTWWILNLANDQVTTVQFGIATDKPVPSDYDGDGITDQAVYRGGEWHLNRSTQGYGVVNWGLATDKPIPADYDGDGKTDLAVYRSGTWYLQQSLNGWEEFNWGISTDIPAPADYDGDGRTDAAVFRDGVWYVRQTTSGVLIQQFGLTNDKPVPAAFLP